MVLNCEIGTNWFIGLDTKTGKTHIQHQGCKQDVFNHRSDTYISSIQLLQTSQGGHCYSQQITDLPLVAQLLSPHGISPYYVLFNLAHTHPEHFISCNPVKTSIIRIRKARHNTHTGCRSSASLHAMYSSASAWCSVIKWYHICEAQSKL